MEIPRLNIPAFKPAPLPPAPAPAAPPAPVAKAAPQPDAMPWDAPAPLATLDEHAQATVEKLKHTGDWDQGYPTPLGERVAGYLADGGSPKLAAAVLDQIRHPRHIHQVGGKNTCAAAAAQELLATHDPSKYFQMATELLATGHTRVDPGNHGFVVNQENRAYIADQGYPLHRKIDATMQAAMLEYANGFVKHGGDLYHMASDTSDHDGTDVHQGVSYQQFNTLTQALVGARVFADQFQPMHQDLGVFGAFADLAQHAGFVVKLGQAVQENLAQSPEGFLMTIHGEHRPHAVMVTGYDADTGMVSYHDPRNTENQDVSCSLLVLSERVTRPEHNVGDMGSSATTGGGGRGR